MSLSSKKDKKKQKKTENIKNEVKMPRRKDDAPKAETVKVRLTLDILERCNAARLAGYHIVDAESRFLGYLVELGLNKYEKIILPIEQGQDESPTIPIAKKKIVS